VIPWPSQNVTVDNNKCFFYISSADDHTDGYMAALAMVSSNGRVFWPPIVKLRSTCSLDITYFPFDDQICTLKFGSWAYDGTQVDVFNRSNGIDLKNYVSNGEWELIEVKVIRNYVIYSCCPEPYPDITFTLHMRRRTLYYTYNVIVPCIMLSALTLLGFWMPPDSGEKVTLGLTVLLAFSVFMLLIAESMPATSFYVPLIGKLIKMYFFVDVSQQEFYCQ
jgi:nicotinic acetylcholine receptor